MRVLIKRKGNSILFQLDSKIDFFNLLIFLLQLTLRQSL